MPTTRQKRHSTRIKTLDASRINGSAQTILIRGARVHNLKNISLELPRNKLIVFTGVSGSGKSSLAFDTIYAEGQRRFVESLSSYARQFLERMDKPDVDFIQGISPAVAIQQKTVTRNARSTVGTTTEIYDYLRLLFARIGETYCYNCGNIVRRDSVRTVLERLEQEHQDELKLYVMFPLHVHEKATLKDELDNLKKQGFFRIVYKEEIIDLNDGYPKHATKKDLFVLVDRLVYHRNGYQPSSNPLGEQTRLADSLESAFVNGNGCAVVKVLGNGKELRFNQHYECAQCGIRYEEPDPRLFSFNNPYGACPKCQGFGRSVGIDLDLVIPDKSKSLRDGAVHPWTFPRWKENLSDALRIAPEAGLRTDAPFEQLTQREVDIVLNGYNGFDGVHEFFRYIERKSYKLHYRVFLSRYRSYTTCDECKGSRLRKEALYVKVGGKTIHDLVSAGIEEVYRFFSGLQLNPYELEVGKRLLEEIRKRLKYLVDVGIGYLTLDRLSHTLSGGESQRINLATALGSSLVGSLYVLDEPSIGLHPRDTQKLIAILQSLRNVGNSVIVVEHDAEMIQAADVLVDLGPRAGEQGGEVVYIGDFAGLQKNQHSLTGKYLTGKRSIPVPTRRRKGNGKYLTVRGAMEHNLKNIDVKIPLGMFVCVTGVSGSGKSTLVHEVLYPGIRKLRGTIEETLGKHKTIEGVEHINDIELVDQSPIGRTPRSNPVTYIKAFDLIRDLSASTQASKIHGYTPGYFSFNVPGGRCETCEGSGVQVVEMQFLADLQLTCENCKGKRFKREVLDVRYRGKNVSDILDMTVSEAVEFFNAAPEGRRAAQRLKVLDDVGLGYIRLGQSATTLSGGEAQRVKLAAHLAERQLDLHKLFIFDEPTTGLHFDDIAKLLKCFDALIEQGNSVLIIEHNMDVIKCADWIIDLGPEAGDKGGQVVVEGTPEDVSKHRASHTGRFLRAYLQ
jgi:excinuclease ABC subunit A